MKTQVIQLENDDDYISVRDKMNWSQTKRILLVFPLNGTNIIHPLELKLIRRNASALGAQLALVTVDTKTMHAAGQVGIPVFDNILPALESEWKVNSQDIVKPKIKNPQRLIEKMRSLGYVQDKPSAGFSITRILILIFATLALIVLGIYLLPGSSQRITPSHLYRSIPSQLLSLMPQHSWVGHWDII